MKMPFPLKTFWSKFGNILLPIAIALIFLLFTFFFYPFREKIQFNTDEGFNVMRSMLVVLGHPLYGEVSSDQPPLFTHLLALVFRVAGFELTPARLLVLLFSTLLVWSCAQFLLLTRGKLAAVLFLSLIILSPSYLVLSVAVMIGVPSIALAAVSMLLVTIWHQKRRNIWLVLSGFALALSMLIKLFTVFLIPVFLMGVTALVYFERRNAGFSWKIFQPAFIWSLCFAGLMIFLGFLLVGPENILKIIVPHIDAPKQEIFQGAKYDINNILETAAIPLLVLGILGAISSIHKRNWLSLYPLAWAVVAYALLNFYTPIWPHHQLLITIPASIMAAIAVADAITVLAHFKKPAYLFRFQTVLGIATLIVFALVTTLALPLLDTKLVDSPRLTGFLLKGTPGKMRLLRTMNDYVDKTHWIVTDMPIYAFLVKRPMPPALATFSQKRMSTGNLTDEDILAAILKYQPEQILLGRFYIPGIDAYLKEHYTLVADPENFHLFVRNDLNPVGK